MDLKDIYQKIYGTKSARHMDEQDLFRGIIRACWTDDMYESFSDQQMSIINNIRTKRREQAGGKRFSYRLFL